MSNLVITGDSTVISEKRIHGAGFELWEKFGLQKFPPVQCEFKMGQKVIFTNEYGLEFEMDVVGYSKDTEFYGRFIHTVTHGTDGNGSAWWFPHRPEELRKA